MEERNFKIILSCDEGYSELCAEILYKNQFIAIVTQEKGFNNLEIEIHPSKDGLPWIFTFSEFLEILAEAKKTLWEMRRIPE